MSDVQVRALTRAMFGGAAGMVVAMLVGAGLFGLALQTEGVVELLVAISRAVWGGILTALVLAPVGTAVALRRSSLPALLPALLTLASMLVALSVVLLSAPDAVALPVLVVFGLAAPLVGTYASTRLGRGSALVAA